MRCACIYMYPCMYRPFENSSHISKSLLWTDLSEKRSYGKSVTAKQKQIQIFLVWLKQMMDISVVPKDIAIVSAYGSTRNSQRDGMYVCICVCAQQSISNMQFATSVHAPKK